MAWSGRWLLISWLPLAEAQWFARAQESTTINGGIRAIVAIKK